MVVVDLVSEGVANSLISYLWLQDIGLRPRCRITRSLSLILPALFVWLLLRPRYSKEIRIGAGIYAAFLLVAFAAWLWKELGF